MVKVEAVIHPSKIEDVKTALDQLEIANIVVTPTYIHNDLPAARGNYRGSVILIDLPRWKVELIISSLQVNEVVDAILNAARSEVPGDQDTVTVFELADAIRINSRKRVGLAWS